MLQDYHFSTKWDF